jgi:hypothetical protein
LESWVQSWLLMVLLFLRKENLRRISICICCSKEEGIGELAPALAVHCPAVLEKNWRRISICTCYSKEEGIGELAPDLAVHCPAVLEENWRRILICTCCSKEEGIGELAPALTVHGPQPDLVLNVTAQPGQLHIERFLKIDKSYSINTKYLACIVIIHRID